jgi:CheY-like chemotaxis protein
MTARFYPCIHWEQIGVVLKQKLKILVVDDEPMVLRSIEMILGHIGHAVEAVDGGSAALARLAHSEFDLVLTDLSMPGMGGAELVDRIRRQIPAQKIIMVSAFAEDYRKSNEGKVNAFLSKPFGIAELIGTINKLFVNET